MTKPFELYKMMPLELIVDNCSFIRSSDRFEESLNLSTMLSIFLWTRIKVEKKNKKLKEYKKEAIEFERNIETFGLS